MESKRHIEKARTANGRLAQLQVKWLNSSRAVFSTTRQHQPIKHTTHPNYQYMYRSYHCKYNLKL